MEEWRGEGRRKGGQRVVRKEMKVRRKIKKGGRREEKEREERMGREGNISH